MFTCSIIYLLLFRKKNIKMVKWTLVPANVEPSISEKYYHLLGGLLVYNYREFNYPPCMKTIMYTLEDGTFITYRLNNPIPIRSPPPQELPSPRFF